MILNMLTGKYFFSYTHALTHPLSLSLSHTHIHTVKYIQCQYWKLCSHVCKYSCNPWSYSSGFITHSPSFHTVLFLVEFGIAADFVKHRFLNILFHCWGSGLLSAIWDFMCLTVSPLKAHLIILLKTNNTFCCIVLNPQMDAFLANCAAISHFQSVFSSSWWI